MGGTRLMTPDVKHNSDGTWDKVRQVGEAESEAVRHDLAPADPELAAIVAKWPALSAAIKAGIRARVQAAGNST